MPIRKIMSAWEHKDKESGQLKHYNLRFADTESRGLLQWVLENHGETARFMVFNNQYKTEPKHPTFNMMVAWDDSEQAQAETGAPRADRTEPIQRAIPEDEIAF